MGKFQDIWVPDLAETVEECAFFAVRITDGRNLSNAAYTALFFHKLVELIDDSRDEGLLEDIEIYFPSLDSLSEEMSNEDLALKVVEAEEFYFGFPPIQEETVECSSLGEMACKRIDGYDEDEFLGTFEENYSFRTIISFLSDLHNSFLASNSEHVYDNQLSLLLSNSKSKSDES